MPNSRPTNRLTQGATRTSTADTSVGDIRS